MSVKCFESTVNDALVDDVVPTVTKLYLLVFGVKANIPKHVSALGFVLLGPTKCDTSGGPEKGRSVLNFKRSVSHRMNVPHFAAELLHYHLICLKPVDE